MNLNHLRGSLVALVTPFDQEENPDFERLGYLIDWHLAAGTDGIVILGTTGESSTMTQEEDDAVCKFTVERVSGRIPRIAGIKEASGDMGYAMEMQLRYLELIHCLFSEVNPIPVKTALALMGKCESHMRLPLYDMSESARKTLAISMRKVQLL